MALTTHIMFLLHVLLIETFNLCLYVFCALVLFYIHHRQTLQEYVYYIKLNFTFLLTSWLG